MKSYLGMIFISLLMVIFVACKPRVPTYDYAQEPDPRTSEFVIGVGDSLSINVWKEAELSSTVIVRPDGTITMPLVGDVKAKGKTPSQLKSDFAKRVSEFVKIDASQITVAVNEVRSYRFTVSGEVGRPGIVENSTYVTVSEAIMLAGGLTRFANADNITILRREPDGTLKQIPIVYRLIKKGLRPDMDIVMMPGDRMQVP